MSEPTRIDAFLAAVAGEMGGVPTTQEHELRVAAKKVRLSVESGAQLRPADWAHLFPDERARSLAQRMLMEVSVMDLDFAATVHAAPPLEVDADAARTVATSPEAIQRQWQALMTTIPDEGLARNDGSGTIASLELGRLVLQVSQGKGHVSFEHLPGASRFRERFVAAARSAGRLELIDGLPENPP